MFEEHTTWSEREEGFLYCPIPHGFLAHGALRGRSESAIYTKRRNSKINWGSARNRETHPLKKKKKAKGAHRIRVEDFPGTQWDAPLADIIAATGVSGNVAVRLRSEAGASMKPLRKGRRAFHYSDFDVSWGNGASTRELMETTGLSRPLVTRLRKEWKNRVKV